MLFRVGFYVRQQVRIHLNLPVLRCGTASLAQGEDDFWVRFPKVFDIHYHGVGCVPRLAGNEFKLSPTFRKPCEGAFR